MKLHNILGKELNAPEGWQDITIYKYKQIMELMVKSTSDGILLIPHEQFMIEHCSVLLDVDPYFFYDADIDDETINILVEIMKPFNIKMPVEKADCFRINGTLYSYNVPDKLTFGEQMSIKLLESHSETVFDSWLNLLTILVRPAQEVVDREFGTTEYIVGKFKVEDADKLLKRRDLFKSLPAGPAYWIIQAFQDGRKN